jgi:hypothetical protein
MTMLVAMMIAVSAAGPAPAAAEQPPAGGVLEVWFDHPAEAAAADHAVHADAFDGALDGAVDGTVAGAPDRLLDPSPGVLLAGMNPITPGRLLDTRIGTGAPIGPLVAGTTLQLPVLGRFGVPASGVDAVALNVTVTGASEPSFLTVWPTGSPFPLASSLNMAPGQTVPNLVIAKVGIDGTVSIANGLGSTHVLADIVGWSGSATFLRSMAPERILDTRDGTGVPVRGKVGPSGVVELAVTGARGVPQAGVDAVILNVTVSEATAPSFVTVWPTGQQLPVASNLNTMPGETNPNLVVAKVGANGRISLFNAAGTVHLLADLVGWIPTGGAFRAITPTRILDTRTRSGIYGDVVNTTFGPVLQPRAGRLRPADTVELDVVSIADLPASATSVLLNLTGTRATQPTFVSAWGRGDPRPVDTSSINIVPNTTRPNLVLAEIGDGGLVSLYNQAGEIDLIADLLGYFEARNASDDLDEVVGEQVHVVHIIPSDQVAPTFGDGDILHTLDVAESWLEGRGGRGIRFDTVGGAPEITTHRIQETAAVLTAEASAPGFDWVEWMLADGLAADGKAYVVFVEGAATGGLCGLGGSGQARVFTLGCLNDANNLTGARPSSTGSWTTLSSARTALHELLHVLGAVSPCAPGYGVSGHVADTADLMYRTQQMNANGMLTAGYAEVLDPQRDDYWGQGAGRVCGDGQPWADVSLSPFLDAAT